MSSKPPIPFDAVILAAGLGTRMKSGVPKVLHEVAGRPLVEHVLATLSPLGPARTIVVVGSGADRVEAALAGRGFEFVRQAPPRGTGDAVLRTKTRLAGSGRLVLILSGDVPLVRTETLHRLLESARPDDVGGAMVTARLEEPDAYGRVVRGSGDLVARVVEAKDATPAERDLREVNAGLYAIREPLLWEGLERLETANAQGEYYLTDVIATLARRGRPVVAVELDDPEEMTGVNNRAELARVGKLLNRRVLERLMAGGVTVVDPDTVWIDDTVEAAPDVTIHPFVRIEGRSRLDAGVTIRSFCRLTSVIVGAGAEVLEGVVASESRLGEKTKVGPWAHLRPGTVLGDRAKVGNFVETKKAILGAGTKASHLTYLGDAEIGEDVNIGAGTITCNYDGVAKHRTVLEDGVFIGSDTQLVAPVRVGRGAYVGAGSTVTEDVPPGALALSRAKQKNVLGWVERKAAKRKRESDAGK